MRAEGGNKGKGKRREKKRNKEGKMGLKSFFCCCFFISPRTGFFICTVVIFQIDKENCI